MTKGSGHCGQRWGAVLTAAAVGLMMLSGCASGSSLTTTPNTSARPAFTGTKTEHMQAIVACMQRKGIAARFEVGVEGDPGMEMPARTRSEIDRNMAAQEECYAELPAPEPTSDADFKVMYDHMIAETDCVRRAGHDVPTIPSWQSFLEAGKARNIDWDPFAKVPDQLRSSLIRECRTDPDLWW